MSPRLLLPLALGLFLLGTGLGCRATGWPPGPSDIPFQSGHYLMEYYAVPGLAPEGLACRLGPFQLEEARGLAPGVFLPLFEAELARAWEANGLRVAPGPCQLTGTVHLISVEGRSFRFFWGRLSARLVVTGTLRREGETLFAFRDRLQVASPVSPGPPAPRETELLLRQASREFAHRLLNELLLHGLTAEGG